jgi:hypothetical protein
VTGVVSKGPIAPSPADRTGLCAGFSRRSKSSRSQIDWKLAGLIVAEMRYSIVEQGGGGTNGDEVPSAFSQTIVG